MTYKIEDEAGVREADPKNLQPRGDSRPEGITGERTDTLPEGTKGAQPEESQGEMREVFTEEMETTTEGMRGGVSEAEKGGDSGAISGEDTEEQEEQEEETNNRSKIGWEKEWRSEKTRKARRWK